MRYLALVTDYDGTLASHGKVSDATATAIQRLRNSGRHAILATGRRLEDVRTVCPYIDAFSQVVAENGALVFDPKRREATLLAEPLPASFLRMLPG
jgi:HAD superfamily hydrolase (TIGR01484 family)